MSLRKTYEQALQNKKDPLDSRDTAVAEVVTAIVAAFRRDGDFTATLKDITDRGFELDIRANLARAGQTVTLSYGDVWNSYTHNQGHVANAAGDLVEQVIGKLAGQKIALDRRSAFKTLLGLR